MRGLIFNHIVWFNHNNYDVDFTTPEIRFFSGINYESSELSGVFWNAYDNYSFSYFLPPSSNHIFLRSEENIYDENVRDEICTFFYEHLHFLKNKYENKIEKTMAYLANLTKFYLDLNENNLNFNDLIIKDVYMSTKDIYKDLEKNQDFILIANDFDISSYLEKLNIFSKKNPKTNIDI